MRRITKLLVANRGEIAAASCAPPEPWDSNGRGLRRPDARLPLSRRRRAVALGGVTGGENLPPHGEIVDAAHRTGADAVHPGTGFSRKRRLCPGR